MYLNITYDSLLMERMNKLGLPLPPPVTLMSLKNMTYHVVSFIGHWTAGCGDSELVREKEETS